MTTGSQAADLSSGNNGYTTPAAPASRAVVGVVETVGREAQGFGDPSVFFGDDKVAEFALGDIHGYDEAQGIP